jgi:hypothetical protein
MEVFASFSKKKRFLFFPRKDHSQQKKPPPRPGLSGRGGGQSSG